MIRILQGDCREVLRTLPDASVHCCVTSPPYMGLRDYQTGSWDGGDQACDHLMPPNGVRDKGRDRAACGGTFHDSPIPNQITQQYRDTCGKCGARRIDAQIGLEASPDAYIAEMVAVFRDVRRVLRDDGTLWLNLGDSYANSGSGGPNSGLAALADRYAPRVNPRNANRDDTGQVPRPAKVAGALASKQLLMMPARVALALQTDGWVLRSDIIWQKPNPMPESCSDRPTSSHEHVFLFAKSTSTTYWMHRYKPGTRSQPAPDYRWVHHKTREEMSLMPVGWDTDERVRKLWRRINLWEGRDYFFDADAVREPHARLWDETNGGNMSPEGLHKSNGAMNERGGTYPLPNPAGRNIRNVWTIAEPMARLRSDLSPADRSFVLAELARRGL